MKLKLSWTILQLFATIESFSCSLNGEDLAFQCDELRFSAGALFQRDGFIMKGHVKKSTNSSSLLQCGQLCLSHMEWCISVNFQLNEKEKTQICELNDFGVKTELEISGNDFEQRSGFIYSQLRPLEVRDLVSKTARAFLRFFSFLMVNI